MSEEEKEAMSWARSNQNKAERRRLEKSKSSEKGAQVANYPFLPRVPEPHSEETLPTVYSMRSEQTTIGRYLIRQHKAKSWRPRREGNDVGM